MFAKMAVADGAGKILGEEPDKKPKRARTSRKKPAPSNKLRSVAPQNKAIKYSAPQD